MTFNLAEYYEKIETNSKRTRANIDRAHKIQADIQSKFHVFEQMKGE